MSLFLQIGFIVIFLFSLLFLYRFIQFVLSYFLGKNYTLTYIDKHGTKRSKRIRTGKDDELEKLLAEIKASTKSDRGTVG